MYSWDETEEVTDLMWF